jgi:hypothetical protein
MEPLLVQYLGLPLLISFQRELGIIPAGSVVRAGTERYLARSVQSAYLPACLENEFSLNHDPYFRIRVFNPIYFSTRTDT